MNPLQCPPLEVLFEELETGRGAALDHARGCPSCSAVLEEHRLLERSLFALADPLPPPEFVSLVMAKVAAAPVPLRAEVLSALGILAGVVVLLVITLVLGHYNPGQLGLSAASGVIKFRMLYFAIGSGMEMLWRTAAVPVTLALSAVLMASLAVLRRVSGNTAVKVEARS